MCRMLTCAVPHALLVPWESARGRGHWAAPSVRSRVLPLRCAPPGLARVDRGARPASPAPARPHPQAMGRQNFGCDSGNWDFKGLQSPNVTLNGARVSV